VQGEITRSPIQERAFFIQFGCAPENVDKLLAATHTEIAAIAKSGIGDTYLEKVREGFRRDRELELRNNQFWSGWLLTAARFHDDPALVLDPSGMMNRATSKNVQAAAKRYLDAGSVYQSVLLPAK
jgi:zinc protease